MSVWDTFNCRKAAGLYLDAVVQTDLDNEETFGEMVRVLWSDDDSREEVQGRLLEWRTTEEKKAAYWWLVRALANADELTPDPIDVRIIWDDHEGRREQMPSVFRKLFAAVNPLLIDPMLWEIGMRRGAALDERIAELPMEHWQAYVDEFSKESGENLLLQMQDVLADVYAHHAFGNQVSCRHGAEQITKQNEKYNGNSHILYYSKFARIIKIFFIHEWFLERFLYILKI